MNYSYDGDGDRVQKSNGKIYWYGAGSEILDESSASGTITDEYVYFGGKRIAHRVASGNTISYYAEDFLGTSRAIATSAGALCYDADFYPFGGERIVTNTCAQNYKFEGKERDAETNNDDFGARYYSSQFGRWTSPDWSAVPAPVPYANLTNPQTLNLYAMVSDNPETFADLDGHLFCVGGSSSCPGSAGGDTADMGGGDSGGGLDVTNIAPTQSQQAPQNSSAQNPPQTATPTMSAAPPAAPQAKYVDPLSGSLEFTVKAGFEIELGDVKAGGSIYKNLTTGESGGEAGVDLGVVGAHVDNPTPPGGNLGGTTEGPQFKVSAGPVEKNLTTGEVKVAPSNTLRFGVTIGIGFEIKLNLQTFKNLIMTNPPLP